MAQDSIEKFGNDILIEQRSAAVRPVTQIGRDGRPMLNAAGNPLTFNVQAAGRAWVIYKKQSVKNSVHPYHGVKTSLAYVWMPIGECNTLDEARAKAKQLSGE